MKQDRILSRTGKQRQKTRKNQSLGGIIRTGSTGIFSAVRYLGTPNDNLRLSISIRGKNSIQLQRYTNIFG